MREPLIVFIVCVVLNVAGLLLDGLLSESGLPTITAYAREHAWVGILIVSVQIVGAMAMTLHIFGK